MANLSGRVAVVTGASRGVGKGIARELAAAGATVYITARRRANVTYMKDKGRVLQCDHRDDAQVAAAFRQIIDQEGRIDILVNNVWGGYENMLENGEFTWTRPFWQQPLRRWDAMFQAGVRAHYVASHLAAARMVSQHNGLIVNLSYWAAQKYLANVAYGVSKAATDKMTADMARELKEYNVAVVSLYPGLVRTEKVLEAAAWLDLSNSESPEFIGRVVVALASEASTMKRTGQVVIAASLAEECGITDIDGKKRRSLTLCEA